MDIFATTPRPSPFPERSATGAAGEPSPAPSSARANRDPALWRAAQSFEAVFLAEMLSHAGAASGGASGAGGGFAEQTFRSLLAREWAEDLSERGGVGLADQIYRSIANAR